MKPLPKSLHTITAVTRLASHLWHVDDELTPEQAITSALGILGYDYAWVPDPHGLAAKALAQLNEAGRPC